jgi:conjugative relaxase-like TrwC/TraI family protein
MLNVSKAMTASAVKKYYPDNYFINASNLPGIFGGELMKEWGLKGKIVEKEAFERITDGYDPLTGADLTQERRENRRAANDITISAPKDFSLIYLAEKDEAKRAKLLKIFVESCDWIMTKMEADAATRVRIGGADDDRTTANWGYAGFLQFDSRPESKPGEDKKEPAVPTIQIHRHHTVFNLTRDPVEQRIKALQIGLVKENADLWMPLFHNELARRVRELGYGIRREKETGSVGFAIAGVPRALVMKHSPRRLTIKEAKKRIEKAFDDPEANEKLAKELGITERWRIELLKEARKKGLLAELAVITRKHKQKDLSQKDLLAFLERQLSPQDRAVLQMAKGQRGWKTTDADAMAYAIEHLSYWRNVIPEKKLLAEALRYGVGSVTLDGLKQEMKRQGVMVDKHGLATTRQLRGQEAFITRMTREGKGKKRPVVAESLDVRRLVAALAGEKAAAELGKQQESSLRALVGSRDLVNVVDAGQGTGKTTMMEHYARILDRYQVPATWLGTTHTAVDELNARGLPAMTLAHFLHSKEAQRAAARSRIILDESSMLAHRDAYQLFLYAKEQGCRLDFVGDSKQYKSPVAGNTMELLRRYGGIAPITMTDTKRQQGRLKAAMEAIRDGKVLDGHQILHELKMVHEFPLDQLTQKAADLYLEWSAKGQDVPVISPTHLQAGDIAQRIRVGLRGRGELSGEDKIVRRLVNLNWSPAQLKDAKKGGGEEGVVLLRYGAYREDTQTLAVGDLVKTTMGGKTKDGKHTLKNGQKHRIAGFTETGDPVLSNGWVVDKDWGGLVPRYVSTGQGAQGITAPRAIVVYGTPSLVATRQEGFYVPVSRVREEVAVLTDSNAALREAIQKQDTRKFAMELFEEPERRPHKVSLPERLKKHVALMRRRLVFEEARERSLPRPELTPAPLHHSRGL